MSANPEIQASAIADAVRAGSVSYYRTRTFNLEFAGLCCLAGESGAVRGPSDSPNAAGSGPDPAFGQGAGMRRLAPGEPILIDLGVNRGGYYVDTTRIFHFGTLPAQFVDAHRASEGIIEAAAEDLAAGKTPEAVYAGAVERAAKAGLAGAFMGGSRFLGHGGGGNHQAGGADDTGEQQGFGQFAHFLLLERFVSQRAVVTSECEIAYRGKPFINVRLHYLL